MSPDAQLPPGRGRQQQDSRGGRSSGADRTSTVEIRPALGMATDEKARRLAEAEKAIADHAVAVDAVRLLEGIARGPKVHRPLTMARALRELADRFEAAA